MEIVGLSDSIIGSKTRSAIDNIVQSITEKYPNVDVTRQKPYLLNPVKITFLLFQSTHSICSKNPL